MRSFNYYCRGKPIIKHDLSVCLQPQPSSMQSSYVILRVRNCHLWPVWFYQTAKLSEKKN